MADTHVNGTVPISPKAAFEIFVQQIDTWWPRRGVFPFSFAPSTTYPRHIRFEGEQNGRFYETFADETEYEIGRITGWDPPNRITYTWRDPVWPASTTITVSFNETTNGTEVIHEQSGFANAGVPELPPYYQIGNQQTLSGFIAHCHAIFELQTLQQNNSG